MRVYPPMTAIVAYAKKNRVIGSHNQLPWHLPDDLKHFKALTRDKTILMGRKTYASIGKPLPHRQNIILTRDLNFQAPGCQVIHHLEDLQQIKCLSPEIYVIGGAEIYRLCLPYCQTVWASEVDADVEGDCDFPSLDPAHWQIHETTWHPADAQHQFGFEVVRYEAEILQVNQN